MPWAWSYGRSPRQGGALGNSGPEVLPGRVESASYIAFRRNRSLPNRFTEHSGVRVTQCESWSDFIEAIRIVWGKPGGTRIYRGHSNPHWKLSSMWERQRAKSHDVIRRFNLNIDSREAFNLDVSEDNPYLVNFKRLVSTMPNMPDHTNWNNLDWWGFGRHFGLHTPLLDWSKSPFIAAFWAFSGRVFSETTPSETFMYSPMTSKDPVVVWELACSQEIGETGVFGVIDNVKYELHRQRAQIGVFTLLNHREFTDLESYLASKEYGNRKMSWRLERYEIPCSSKEEAALSLSDLNRMNINYATVFPDSEGAALQANFASHWFEMETNLGPREKPSWDSPPLSRL